MTNLTESSTWEGGIYQLETDDPTLGGPPGFNMGEPVTGHSNAQAQQLANRTKWLYDNKADKNFTQGGLGSVVRTVDSKLKDFVSVKDFGAVGDGVADDTSSIQATLNFTSRVYIPKGTYKTTTALVVPDNVKVICDGKIQASSQLTVISWAGTDDSSWIGGHISGDGVTTGQSGVLLSNANRNILEKLVVTGCLNKGIDITGTSSNNIVSPILVSGSTSSSGVGLSMFGTSVVKNEIRGGLYTGNRIGMSLNGASYNRISSIDVSSNTDIGFTIDGVITNSGDGGKYNDVSNIIANNTTTLNIYSGIYLGNGSSYNNFSNVVANGNIGAGIRQSGGVGYECVGNIYSNVVVEANSSSGIVLSFSPRTKFSNVFSRNNTGRGVSVFSSDYTSVSNLEATNNTTVNILVQSGYTRFQNVICEGGTHGYQVAFGGSADSSNNVLSVARLTGASTANLSVATGLGRVYSITGASNVVNADVGDSNFTVSAGTATTVIYNTPITANRSVTLSTGSIMQNGDRARIVRTANCTGAFNISVGSGPLKSLTLAGQWCEVEYNGTAWVLTGYGSL